MISDPRACLELLPEQVNPVVDKHKRGPSEHLIPHNAAPEVHRVLELVFVVVRPLIKAVEWSDKEDGIKAFEERCPSQFLNQRRFKIKNEGSTDTSLPSSVLNRRST